MPDIDMQDRIVIALQNFAVALPTAMTVLLAFWALGRLAQAAIGRVCRLRAVDQSLTGFFGRAARTAALAFGIIIALSQLGLDVTALVAGLGLTGFALGFALKDIISNALSGMLTIMFRPFATGDRIRVAAFEGEVREIDLRYTVLDADGQRVHIPNSLFMTNAVSVAPGEKALAAQAPAG